MRLRLACAAVFFALVPLHTLSQEVVLSRPSTGAFRFPAARRPAPNFSDAAPARLGIHILRVSREGISCQQLQGRPEIRDLDVRSFVSLHQINHLPEGTGRVEKASTGLTINLRATAQLEQYPQGRSYFSFASFEDPDGNRWLLQEITTRLPGREWESTGAQTTDVVALAELLRETSEHHDPYEKSHAEHHWWDWYAPYLSARQKGSNPEQAAAAAERRMEEVLHVLPR